ncbi:MAG: hypothetical protein JXA74_01710 [Anaerolineae bacterium]|nr:hypothetical protein [Anaerolineae bacterium]
MKTAFKVLAIVTAVVVILASVTAVVLAQTRGERGRAAEQTELGLGLGPAQAQGRGFGSESNQVRGQGQNTPGGVDEDGDGICDICGESREGAAEGYGLRNGQGRGGFGGLGNPDCDGDCENEGAGPQRGGVDADGDGICDICGESCEGLDGQGPFGRQGGGIGGANRGANRVGNRAANGAGNVR